VLLVPLRFMPMPPAGAAAGQRTCMRPMPGSCAPPPAGPDRFMTLVVSLVTGLQWLMQLSVTR
jgi:hypothetical protein